MDASAARSRRFVVGMSGSSGAIFGIRLLEVLSAVSDVETHLVMSTAAAQTIALETDYKPRDVEAMATRSYKIGDIAASLSSGSFRTEGMVIVPCSMKTVAAIAYGYDENLLARAADVTLKERRRLIVCPRETPLHLGHLRALTQLAEIGAVIAPLMPAFYGRPSTIEDLVDHQVGRLLDLLGIETEGLAFRWKGAKAE
ncbi:MAG TPA: UbiX family flavin prenyltransferase [Vicinamibacterales bacterium]|nr:UbiX family flavin prenyltransferase [Vicinamibacterales bacterium]